MTSNRLVEEWGKLVGDVPAASTILDRFLHHAKIINITGRIYGITGTHCRQTADYKSDVYCYQHTNPRAGFEVTDDSQLLGLPGRASVTDRWLAW